MRLGKQLYLNTIPLVLVVNGPNDAFLPCRSPAKSRIRAKMLYATSKQGLRRVLDGVHYEVQATDPTEMGFDVITERAK